MQNKNTIQIKVKSAAGISDFMPSKVAEHIASVPQGTDIATLLDTLGVPRTAPSIILVNKVTADLNHVLTNGDTVHLLPMIVGG